MNKTIRKILIAVVSLIIPVLTSSGAFAISSEEIFTKVLINNVESCYKNALISNIGLTSYSGFNSLMNDGYKQAKNTQHGLYIPAITDNYNKITETDSAGARLTSCYALFAGDATALGTLDGSMKGLFEIYGKTAPGGPSNVNLLNNFMGDQLMQYSINTEAASSNEYCYSVYVKESTTAATPINLGSACMNEDNYPLSIVNNLTFTGGEENTSYTFTGGVKMTGADRSASVGLDLTITDNESQCYDGGRGVKKCSSTLRLSTGVPEEGTKDFPSSQYWYNAPSMYVEISKKSGDSEDSKNVSYSKNNNKWKDFILALTGKNYDDFAFNDAEKYDFYLQYLKNNYGRNGTSIGSTTCQASKPSSLVDSAPQKYYIYIKGSGWCLANLDSNKVNTQHVMTVFTKNNYRTLSTYISTLPELIELMGELNYDDDSAFVSVEQSGEVEGAVIDPTVSGTTGETSGEVTCLNSGAAESLGWILCPIMSWLGRTSETIYTNIVEPALQVEPQLFTATASGATESNAHKAWSTFQGFANMFFIVLLLVVIFSQLTGVGIDNYGIKRILPKLIVAAILVNLSYYICVILVDISNIAGNGIQALFNNLTNTQGLSGAVATIPNPDGGEAFSIGTSIGSTVLTAIPIAIGLYGLGAVVWQNPAVLLSLLVSLIGVVISVLFLFVILAAREAAIVVLTIISPLAFACYMLPNTKNLFDKWVKMGEGLLLVYPICGLLVGGGGYISKLLLSTGAEDFFGAFAAILISIAPIFFIPSVLRSSFAAMGNLGAKISGFGDRLRGGVDKRIRGTEAYKDAQKRSLERRTRVRAGIGKDGQPTERGKRRIARSQSKWGKLTGADRRQAAYIAAAKKTLGEYEEADAQLTNTMANSEINNRYNGNAEAYYRDMITQAAGTGNINEMNSAISAAVSSGYVKDKEIAKIVRDLSNGKGRLSTDAPGTGTRGFNFKNDDALRSAFMRDMSTKYGNGFLSSDFELKEFARKGGGATGALGDYGSYAASNSLGMDDIKPEDLIKLSGDSLAGILTSGKVDASMAQRVLAMNPNISAEKKIMLGAIADGKAKFTNLTAEDAIKQAGQFKKDAMELMKNHSLQGLSTIETDASGKLADKWTASTPQAIRIQETDIPLR